MGNEDESTKNGVILNIRRRSLKKEPQCKNRSRSASRTKKWKWFHCQKPDHFQRDCLDRKKPKDQGEAVLVDEGYDSSKVLWTSLRQDNHCWILDNGCTFHLNPNKSRFKSFEEVTDGHVLLGNDKSYKVIGIGSIILKMYDDIEIILQEWDMFLN